MNWLTPNRIAATVQRRLRRKRIHIHNALARHITRLVLDIITEYAPQTWQKSLQQHRDGENEETDRRFEARANALGDRYTLSVKRGERVGRMRTVVRYRKVARRILKVRVDEHHEAPKWVPLKPREVAALISAAEELRMNGNHTDAAVLDEILSRFRM